MPHDGAGKDLEFEQKKLREYGRKGDGGAKREREQGGDFRVFQK